MHKLAVLERFSFSRVTRVLYIYIIITILSKGLRSDVQWQQNIAIHFMLVINQ